MVVYGVAPIGFQGQTHIHGEVSLYYFYQYIYI